MKDNNDGTKDCKWIAQLFRFSLAPPALFPVKEADTVIASINGYRITSSQNENMLMVHFHFSHQSIDSLDFKLDKLICHNRYRINTKSKAVKQTLNLLISEGIISPEFVFSIYFSSIACIKRENFRIKIDSIRLANNKNIIVST